MGAAGRAFLTTDLQQLVEALTLEVKVESSRHMGCRAKDRFA